MLTSATAASWRQDQATVQDKALLPVTAVHFGDTGTPLDTKEGRFSVGRLLCRSDLLSWDGYLQ